MLYFQMQLRNFELRYWLFQILIFNRNDRIVSVIIKLLAISPFSEEFILTKVFALLRNCGTDIFLFLFTNLEHPSYRRFPILYTSVTFANFTKHYKLKPTKVWLFSGVLFLDFHHIKQVVHATSSIKNLHLPLANFRTKFKFKFNFVSRFPDFEKNRDCKSKIKCP